ncbi:sel1 repeat family protein [Mameliella sp. CS4]|uniref:tetratricopeptide repeat protein n=1 Tax=Mameliella sp. CS4 TaxID=2862329 RepID=UPI001C6046C5|nr:tetratricopeptide repeat protein [Mameliella sp. CS4]MBW4982884.1 sel1 repeat family protein [Mameliella sp. CS4]
MTASCRPLLSAALVCALALSPLPLAAQDAADPPAEAQDLPEMAKIEQAWNAGDFVTVRQGLKVLAEETGTALAQYRYGRILIEGRGGPRDPKGAALWLERAVEQNHAEAATLLARLYLSQVPGGPERDAKRAAELLNRAATRGDAPAQYLLALLYQNGDGVERDTDATYNWLLAAAEQRHAQAQFALAAIHLNSETGDRDEGIRWLRAAAGQGIADAQIQLATLLDRPDTPVTNRAEALDWYRRAAESGHVLAQRMLGTRYLTGDGVTADPQEALRWLGQAAQAGDPGAMSNLGYAFAAGQTLPQDLKQAARWYGMAAEQGLGRAMVALARMYETGAGVTADFDAALALYTKALDSDDDAMARVELGRLAAAGQLDGRVAPQRAVPWVLAALRAGNTEALTWLETRAEAGDPAAQSALGRYLLTEDETRRAEAVSLLTAAADRGNGPAQFALAGLLARGDHGSAPDYVEAHKWYNIAATFGHPDAPEQREVLGNLMTPEQLAQAQAAARAWFEADAARGPVLGGN